jgi:hypothetical protein
VLSTGFGPIIARIFQSPSDSAVFVEKPAAGPFVAQSRVLNRSHGSFRRAAGTAVAIDVGGAVTRAHRVDFCGCDLPRFYNRRVLALPGASCRLGTPEELSEAKNTAERQGATATEALTRVEAALAEEKARLTATEQSRDELLLQVDAIKAEKSKVEETLASKTEDLTRNETAMEDLRSRLNQATSALDATRQELGESRSELAALNETLAQEGKQTDEKLALLVEAKERMMQEFKLRASDVMNSNRETFSKQNKEQIDVLLPPLREKLGEFQIGLQTAHTGV